ncbi:uncharacterized protein LOC123712862 [Pieris brassicae]|uniref:uncharacterized protein LOC123712862 n=1 Tax=Pieris brassicae TaxID=7116 RepID=UPI001E660009|nr:uncharacterized protein LOC123712862 [Pieris brassicae]
MDTNEYETFEYLQPNNVESIPKRLFVVQDHGTYLSFDRNVDLSQVQNVELLEEVQPVYDVSPEQFYIDVEGSQEIVAVSEQFVLSNELHNEDNIYENNLMLHESGSSNIQIQQAVDEIPENVVEQFIKKEPSNTEMNMEMDTTPNNFTEVMLSDEQYKFLEQRGWTLIENNDNIFFIDGLGLHNITNNDQLIQDLKQKMKDNELTDKDSRNTTETIIFEETFENNEIKPSISFIEEKKEPDIPKLSPIKILPKPDKKAKEVPDLMPSEREFLETTVNELSEKYENSDPRINSNTIKIKTKFSLKDIPSEIVLGKTVNGKRLIARVTKRERRDTSKITDNVETKNHKTPQTNAFDQKIEKLLQQAICGEMPPVTDKDVIDNADRLIIQLLRVPAFKPAVIEKRLIITKISITEDEEQNPTAESGPLLITGRVVNKGDDHWSFQYIPDMLQRLKENGASEEGFKELVKNKGNSDVDVNLLQIHIQEVIGPDGCARCSITLHRRVIVVKCKKVTDSRRTKARVYACDTCAVTVNTQNKLLQHQELHTVADNLKTNTVRTDAMYTTSTLGSNRNFECNQCEFETSKQSIIHRHIKSHFSILIKASEKPNDELDEKLNCKLCSSSFTDATSLSKHIVSSHIKVIET